MFRIVLIATLLTVSSYSHAEQHSAVVLMYHQFGAKNSASTNIRLDQFDAHLDYLARNNFTVWPLEKVVSYLQQNKTLPDRTIAITMDDAYRSIYTEAFPRLKKRNWPFTVFVSTDPIDKHYPDYMSWDEMREMEQRGATFANHSRSHDHLPQRKRNESAAQWRQRMQNDLQHAQQRLQSELKQVIPFFAYPYGEYNLELAQMVAEMKLTGMGQHSGAIGPHYDFRYLTRFPMNEHYGEMNSFISKVQSLAMPLERDPGAEPVTSDKRPSLTLTFDKEHPRLRQLSCYFNDQPMKLDWRNDFEVRVQPQQDLAAGRSRYNCTAPSNEKGRFYWFSQQWVRPDGEGKE
jgi:peptidoglycan/xylan/chitin deacetylase (PgdA/CDA1 family)